MVEICPVCKNELDAGIEQCQRCGLDLPCFLSEADRQEWLKRVDVSRGEWQKITRVVQQEMVREYDFWICCLNQPSIALLEEYQQRFPSGRFMPEATEALRRLEEDKSGAEERFLQETLILHDSAGNEVYPFDHYMSRYSWKPAQCQCSDTAIGIMAIDLGASNLCSAFMQENGIPFIIPTLQGERSTPCYVNCAPDGTCHVGQTTKSRVIMAPESTLFGVLDLVGQQIDSDIVRRIMAFSPFKIVPAKNGEAWIETNGQVYSPLEVLAWLLAYQKVSAEKRSGRTVTDAVIAIPSYLGHVQKNIIRQAAFCAGIHILRFMGKSIATMMSCDICQGAEELKIAILYFGASSLEVTIAETGNGVMEVKSVYCAPVISGEEIDRRIIDWLIDYFETEHHVALAKTPMTLHRLKLAAVKTKHDLSFSTTSAIDLPFLGMDALGQPLHLLVTMTRIQLENLCRDLPEALRKACDTAAKEAEIDSYREITTVILAGGMSRMPLVHTTLAEVFSRTPERFLAPEEAAVIGAAVQAGLLRGDIKDILLLQATHFSLGIEQEGKTVRMIEKNTTIPSLKTHLFPVPTENQSFFPIHVLEGENEVAAENTLIGSFTLTGIAKPSTDNLEIEITIGIDANDRIDVLATIPGTDQKETFRITGNDMVHDPYFVNLAKRVHEAQIT